MLSKPLVSAALKPLVLSMLAEKPMYGFQITHRAKILADGQVHWSNSKLYPLLHKLEQDGLVIPFWKPSDSGPDRKYYRITPSGLEALDRAKSEWLKVNAMFARLWSPGLALS